MLLVALSFTQYFVVWRRSPFGGCLAGVLDVLAGVLPALATVNLMHRY